MHLLPQGGHYYKANLHCHTTCSDGRKTKEEIKTLYKEQGYSVVAITDHNVYHYHKELNDEHFITLAGFEANINDKNGSPDFSRLKTYHFNFFDCDPDSHSDKKNLIFMPKQDYHEITAINRYIADMKNLGFLCSYNHPYWSLQNYMDYRDLKDIWAMEIYNHGCEMEGFYGYHPQAYEEMLRSGQRLFCVATDDNHNCEEFEDPLCDSFGGFTMIHAAELTYKAIMESLRAGNFYASMGPEIYEFSQQGMHLTIKTSPVDKIMVQTEGRKCFRKAAKQGENITEAEFELSGNEGYIRLTIKDAKGLYANSNAYFVSDLHERRL